MKKNHSPHHAKAKHHMEKMAMHHEKALHHMEKANEHKEMKLISRLSKMHKMKKK